MKIQLTTEDINKWMDYWGDEVTIEVDPEALFGEEIKKAVADAVEKYTTYAGPLYQEIRKQVDEYMDRHLRTNVGNYVRVVRHEADRIIRESVADEIKRGVELGVKVYAERTAKQIAEKLSPLTKVEDEG